MSHRATSQIEKFNHAIEECRAAIIESQAALDAATRHASQPNAKRRDKLQVLFYQQELRELKKWLAEAEQKLEAMRQGTQEMIAG